MRKFFAVAAVVVGLLAGFGSAAGAAQPTTVYSAAVSNINGVVAQPGPLPGEYTFGYTAFNLSVYPTAVVSNPLPRQGRLFFVNGEHVECSIPVSGYANGGQCTFRFENPGLHRVFAVYFVHGSAYVSPTYTVNIPKEDT